MCRLNENQVTFAEKGMCRLTENRVTFAEKGMCRANGNRVTFAEKGMCGANGNRVTFVEKGMCRPHENWVSLPTKGRAVSKCSSGTVTSQTKPKVLEHHRRSILKLICGSTSSYLYFIIKIIIICNQS